MASGSHLRLRTLIVVTVTVFLPLATSLRSKKVSAQSAAPVLISQETSTRAIAFDSVTQQHEPFSTSAPLKFGADNQTRVMLFAMNFNLLPGDTVADVSVDAEDGAHNSYHLPVEFIGSVPDQPWATSIVVRLPDALNDAGDVLVGINYRGVASNRVRVAIGHVGGGPPDDDGAVPTPGSITPLPQPAATAGNLTTTEVQTIISQAVSAAASLSHPVTVAVTDREANVLGVFKMTGAPTTTQFRGGGPGPVQVPNPITGFVPVGLDGTVVPSQMAAISKAATAAIFSTSGNAFTSRTAGFIIQEHFPPGVDFTPGGPLYGVQFSSLPCSA